MLSQWSYLNGSLGVHTTYTSNHDFRVSRQALSYSPRHADLPLLNDRTNAEHALQSDLPSISTALRARTVMIWKESCFRVRRGTGVATRAPNTGSPVLRRGRAVLELAKQRVTVISRPWIAESDPKFPRLIAPTWAAAKAL